MKIYCLERDICGYVYYLVDEDYTTIDFNEIVRYCPECGNYTLLVKNDFSLEDQDPHNLDLFKSSIEKIFRKK
jgi:ribosomal protein S27AE